eukprot:scaffold27701_cov101-Isochrysis_galbana.AAC.2
MLAWEGSRFIGTPNAAAAGPAVDPPVGTHAASSCRSIATARLRLASSDSWAGSGAPVAPRLVSTCLSLTVVRWCSRFSTTSSCSSTPALRTAFWRSPSSSISFRLSAQTTSLSITLCAAGTCSTVWCWASATVSAATGGSQYAKGATTSQRAIGGSYSAAPG